MKRNLLPLLGFLCLSLYTSAQTTEWDFTIDEGGWLYYIDVTGSVSGGDLNYTITGTNPAIRYTYPTGQVLPSSTYRYLHIKFKNGTTVTSGRFSWYNNNTLLGQTDFPIISSSGQYVDYTVDLSAITAWTGSTNINRIYIFLPLFTATTGQPISIDYIRFDSVTPPVTKPRIGAIRWDGWAGDSSTVGRGGEQDLSPQKWHYRLPFFATEVSSDSVRINGNSQAIMDQEINYASNAGLDYWAFVLYKNNDPLYYGLSRYLSSSIRNKINFSLIVIPDYFRDTAALNQVKSLILQSGYVTVMNGRPLLYLYNTSTQTIAASFGGQIQNFRTALDNFRTWCTTNGLQQPYIVIMDPSPVEARAYTDSLGTDAISAYSSYNVKNEMAGTYNSLVSASLGGVEGFWNTCKSTGSQVVPDLMAGWDFRPRTENPLPYDSGEVAGADTNMYFQQPTPTELKQHFQHALNWLDSNRLYSQANIAIAYAWNENDEGGYLVPTLYDGSIRLDTLKTLLNPDTTETASTKAVAKDSVRSFISNNSDSSAAPGWKVYASPQAGQLVLDIQSPVATPATLQLYDMDGACRKTQLLQLQAGENILYFDDSGLGHGVYIITCKTSRYQLSRQFLK